MSNDTLQRLLDEHLGRPIHKGVTIVGPNAAGEFHIDFEGSKRRLVAVYLCPWDRTPLLAMWEHGGRPIPEQQLNGFLGIGAFVRMNRKSYEMSMIKAFSTADLQGCVFYDVVPGMSEAGVAQIANAETQMLMDARSAKDKAAENKIQEAMLAGRHSHPRGSTPYFYDEAVKAKAQKALDERLGPLMKPDETESYDFCIIRAVDPRTVLDDTFIRILWGLLTVAEEVMRTDERGVRYTRASPEHMAKMPDGVEQRIAFAQHYGRMYFRSANPDAMERLTKGKDPLGWDLDVLTPLPELTGKGKPMYVLNLTRAYQRLDLFANKLTRPGMPKEVPKGYGYSDQSFDNVLLIIETLLWYFSQLGDLQLTPQLGGYIRERTGHLFELIQERVTQGTETQGKELIRKWERERKSEAEQLFLEDPVTDGERNALQLVLDKAMTEETFNALPDDMKDKVAEWMTRGLVVDAASGRKTYKPFDIRFSENAERLARSVLSPPQKPEVAGPGVPEFVLSVDRLRDTERLVEEARSMAMAGTKEATAGSDHSGYLWLRGATMRYKDSIKELVGARWHPEEQAWTVKYRTVGDIPGSSPVYHAIKRGELTTMELTPEQYEERYGRQ